MKLLQAVLWTSATLCAQVVEGTVVSSVNSVPIAGVVVTIEKGGKTAYRATTDAQGAFRIELTADGEYTATFHMLDFQPPGRETEARRPFRATAGSGPVRLHARMTPWGRVSGRVLDAPDHGVPDAHVTLMMAGWFNGQEGPTDAKGAFSFAVEPGSYVLDARAPASLPPPAPEGGQRRGWVRTYYPGVAERQAAAKIVVNAGARIEVQDIVLRAAPVYRLTGVVLDAAGDPMPRVPLTLTRAEELQPEGRKVGSAEDGSFEYAGLYDGAWQLSAAMKSDKSEYRAITAVQVAGRDIDRLELRLGAPFIVHGSVSFDGETVPKRQRSQAGVVLAPQGGGSPPQGGADRDGNIVIEKVFQGTYKIMPIFHAAPYYLAAVTMNGRDVLGQYIEIGPGSPPFKIVYRSDGGAVRGTVEECGGATVVLMPQDAGLREAELIRTVRCGENGGFEIPYILPGDYYVLALDQLEIPFFLGRAFDQSLVNSSVTARIRPGEATTVTLRVTPRVIP